MTGGRRILVIANSRFPDGAANAVNVFSMAAAFAALGHRVRLLALRSHGIAGGGAWRRTARRFGRDPGVRATLLWWPPGRLSEPWLALVALTVVPFAAPGTLVFTRVRYAAAVAAAFGRQVVFESHAPPVDRFRRRLDAWLLRRGNVRLVVISESLRRLYAEAGLPAAAILVAPDAGWALSDTGPQPDDFQGPVRDIGYVGTLYAGRGIDVILAMAGGLPERRFHVIGPLDSYAEADAAVPGNVTFYDAVTPAQAQRLCRLFDVLLMPYQRSVRLANRLDTAAWMSPMKMFEYMLAERPVIASDLPVLREVLRDGDTALLVAPADTEAWVAAVRRLDDPGLRQSLARSAWADAMRRHTWPARARAILASLS